MKQRGKNNKIENVGNREESVGEIQAGAENIKNKTKDSAEDGADIVKDKAEDSEDIVKDKVKDSEDIVKDKAKNSEDIAKGKAEDGAEIVKDKTEDSENSTETTGKSARKKILIPVGILFILILVCCCAYCAVAFSYRDKFLPGTWVNGIDCTELDGEQVAGLLTDQLQTYCLDVTGRDYASGALGSLLGQVTAEDIHLSYSVNSREAVDDLLAKQNIFTWLYRKQSDNTYSFQVSQGVSYDEEQLENIVKDWEACRPGNMKAPQNAYISECADKRKGYEVIPEVEGTKFDVQKLLELMNAAILSQETSLDLEAEGCYEEPEVRQDAAELTEPVETVNKWLEARITYDWNGTEIIIDRELIRDWITMEKDGPVLDKAAVATFVKEQAEENDTYGKRRNFVTTLGVELSLPSGYYGWLTDTEAETKELIEAICRGETVSREPVYASRARQKGTSDIGNSYVEVDLTHQHLYLYMDGAIIFETDFVSGSMSSTPDCVTPEGVFGISYKTTNAVLRGANYETPVNYWMPFYGNYGLHDATWRSEFGGQIYIENGSHGCVNLPLDAAATIYGHMSTGFPVICYYYQVDPLAAQPVEEDWDDDDDDEEE